MCFWFEKRGCGSNCTIVRRDSSPLPEERMLFYERLWQDRCWTGRVASSSRLWHTVPPSSRCVGSRLIGSVVNRDFISRAGMNQTGFHKEQEVPPSSLCLGILPYGAWQQRDPPPLPSFAFELNHCFVGGEARPLGLPRLPPSSPAASEGSSLMQLGANEDKSSNGIDR